MCQGQHSAELLRVGGPDLHRGTNALEAGATQIEWQSRISPAAKLPGYAGRVIEISITNDGTPVPEHIQTRLFEPFVTSKSRGSGLGLALVQRVMLEHGGRVQLRSEHGRTRFTLQFPLEVFPS